MKTIEKSLAVFCLATYGEGDPTDNAMEFWEWIQGDVDLAGLNYAVSKLHSFLLNFFDKRFLQRCNINYKNYVTIMVCNYTDNLRLYPICDIASFIVRELKNHFASMICDAILPTVLQLRLLFTCIKTRFAFSFKSTVCHINFWPKKKPTKITRRERIQVN